MSGPCNPRKHPVQKTGTTRSKREKLSELHAGSQPPPAYWDNLSQIWFTKNALREFDRRNRRPSERSPYPPTRRPITRSFLAAWKRNHRSASEFLDGFTAEALKGIRQLVGQLARHGGPDTSGLRGYPEPISPLDRTMSSNESSFRGHNRCPPPLKRKRLTVTTAVKNTGPYDRNFQQKLIDGRVFPDRYHFPDNRVPSKPINWEEMKQRATRHRASLSLSTFSDVAHDEFVQADADAKSEDQVMKSVIPVIEGKIRDAKCTAGRIPFRNLSPLTDGTLVPGNPDLYYGARPEQLNQRVREDLSGQIIPSTQHDIPIAPNFFLAAKGPDGLMSVAGRQASYDGTLGERGQVGLGSWGLKGTALDGKAHTITSTYYAGVLKFYSIHAAQPNGPGSPFEYYMNAIGSWLMNDDPRYFRQGAAAFRNLRDWAEEQRNSAIKRANERAKKIEVDDAEDVDDDEAKGVDVNNDEDVDVGDDDEAEDVDEHETKDVDNEDLQADPSHATFTTQPPTVKSMSKKAKPRQMTLM